MACITDTASINLTVAAGQLSADLVVDPGTGLPPNPLVVNPAGVYVIGADGWIPLPSTLAFTSADGHTFVAASSADLRTFIGPGDKIRLVQSGVPGYYFVTAITAGTITLYGGTDYTLAALAISTPYFSKSKSPVGFPLSPAKWTEEFRDNVQRLQASPVNGTWYNPGTATLPIPIGAWRVLYLVSVIGTYGGGVQNATSTLSTANNSESDIDLSAFVGGVFSAGDTTWNIAREKFLLLAAKTSYFLNVKDSATASALGYNGGVSPTLIRAISAYL